MIANYWPDWFRTQAYFDNGWPTTYLAMDLETTGYAADRDVITEYGHCLVEDGRITDRLDLVLDWTEHPVVPQHWLRDRIASVRSQMELAGNCCHTSIERMKSEGMEAGKALAFIRDFLATIMSKQIPLVLHGGIFDEKMLAGNFIGFRVANGFSFGPNGWIDTEGVAKASQLLDNPRAYPKRGDSLRDYWHRVKYTRVTGVKSSLDSYCYAKYKLGEVHGIARKDMHRADVDAYCCHLLMTEYAKEVTPAAIEAPSYAPEHRDLRQGKAPPVSAVPPRANKRVRGQRNS